MTGIFKRFRMGAARLGAGILLAILAVAPSASQATTYYDFRFTLRYVDAFYVRAAVSGDGPDGYELPPFSTLAKSDDIWGFLDPFAYTPGQEWDVRIKAAVANDGSAIVECRNSPIECSGFYGFEEVFGNVPAARFSRDGRISLCLGVDCTINMFGTVSVGGFFDYGCQDGTCFYGGFRENGRYLEHRDYQLLFEVTSVEPVPLPASALLLLGATAGLGVVARRSSRKGATRWVAQ
ncbi:VPLPA-CTERM sorting domain-containing protein [Palleronia sp. KMU-117]|uniref:VPLPA-CTERM sorting domain-containing protein n=1 Tax=Palleronia sp. KMU-117 TaxID=3434108 RepID=UPI003D7462CC